MGIVKIANEAIELGDKIGKGGSRYLALEPK